MWSIACVLKSWIEYYYYYSQTLLSPWMHGANPTDFLLMNRNIERVKVSHEWIISKLSSKSVFCRKEHKIQPFGPSVLIVTCSVIITP